MTAKSHLEMIKYAVMAQAEDQGLWSFANSISVAYLQQALRNLHRVIEEADERAMENIIDCAMTTSEVPLYWNDE